MQEENFWSRDRGREPNSAFWLGIWSQPNSAFWLGIWSLCREDVGAISEGWWLGNGRFGEGGEVCEDWHMVYVREPRTETHHEKSHTEDLKEPLKSQFHQALPQLDLICQCLSYECTLICFSLISKSFIFQLSCYQYIYIYRF